MANFGGGTIERFSPTGTDLGVFASGLSEPSFLAFAPASVPEPSTFTLAVLGGLGLIARSWRPRPVKEGIRSS